MFAFQPLNKFFLLALVVGTTTSIEYQGIIPDEALARVPKKCEPHINDVGFCVLGTLRCWFPFVDFIRGIEITDETTCDDLEDASCYFFRYCVECEDYVTDFMACVESEVAPTQTEEVVTVCDTPAPGTDEINCYNITKPGAEFLGCGIDLNVCLDGKTSQSYTLESSKGG